MQITMDIVEVEGRTFEGVKCLGMVPEALEADDFNIYVRWHEDGSVTADRSDTDRRIVASHINRGGKAAAFAELMTSLATYYGVPVVVACDPDVSGGQSTKMVGTYEPREGAPAPVAVIPTVDVAPVMRTADGVVITDGMAVWDYNLDAGTVDLGSVDSSGWFHVKLFKGGQSLMNAERVSVVHPYTRERADGGNLMVTDATPATQGPQPTTEWVPDFLAWADSNAHRVDPKVITVPAVEIHTADGVITEQDVRARAREAFKPTNGFSGQRVVTDRTMGDQVKAYLNTMVDDFYVDGIVDRLIKDNNGAVDIDTLSTKDFLAVLDMFHAPREVEVWGGTGTLMVKSPIRTKMGRRARKSARRARRGAKGGM